MGGSQIVGKVCFFKKVLVLYPYKNALWALRPAKPLGVLSRHPCRNPKPLPRGERLCMLGWLCIVQSLWAYTPGVRAGAECGATAPRPCRGLRPCDPIFINDRSFSTDWNEPPVWEARKEITYSFSSY